MAEELVQVFAQLTNQINLLSSAFREEGILSRIENFKGDFKKFKSWIREIEKAARICNLNVNQKKLLAYQTAEGRVGDYVERYLETNPNATWENLKDELRDRFGEFVDPHLALSKLREIRIERGESVQVYAERLLGHARDAFRDQPGGLNGMQIQLVAFFIDGLPDKIRLKVMRDNPATLNDAIVSARNEQALQTRFALRGRGHASTGAPIHQDDRQETPMEVCVSKFKAKCFKCGRYGHRQRDCRVTVTTTPGSERQQKKVNIVQVAGDSSDDDQVGPVATHQTIRQGRPAPGKCWHCGEIGHYKNGCPRRKGTKRKTPGEGASGSGPEGAQGPQPQGN